MNIGIAGIDYFRLELRNPNSITYDTIRNKVHSEFWMTKTFGRIRSSIVFSFFSILSFRNNVLMNNTGWLTKCIDITQSRLELRNPNSITCDTIRNKVHSEFWMTKTLRTIRSSIVFLFFLYFLRPNDSKENNDRKTLWSSSSARSARRSLFDCSHNSIINDVVIDDVLSPSSVPLPPPAAFFYSRRFWISNWRRRFLFFSFSFSTSVHAGDARLKLQKKNSYCLDKKKSGKNRREIVENLA